MLTVKIIILTLVFSVISFLVFGILYLDEGYRYKKSAKINRGWKLLVCSTILIVALATPVISLIRYEFSEDRWDSINYGWYLIILIILPILGGIISAHLGYAARFLVIGYRNQRKGNRDPINIAYGYTLLSTGAVLFIATTMFIIGYFTGNLL